MDQTTLLDRCRQIALTSGHRSASDHGSGDDVENWGPEDAIGFFQSMRPDGLGLAEVFEGVPHGEELCERLDHLFTVAGDSTRPGGGRDAYFVVRQPVGISAELIEHAGKLWLEQLALVDQKIGEGKLAELISKRPAIRVLEGSAPKHPRDPDEHPELLTWISGLSKNLIEPLRPPAEAVLGLRQAYYFIACDGLLREYLMWPVYRELVGLDDPLEPYFSLWRYGVKYRIFNNQSVDLYMPRKV